MSNESVLDKHYDPAEVEGAIYAKWEASGAFRAPITDPPVPRENTFTIVIPPPNVTGALHLGHALNNTLQDILIRYHRMRGFHTLWQPGTDHAGIATQAVVEKRIRETEGKTRHQLGREELVRRIWEWKDEYEKRILNQLKQMGCSCDWGYREVKKANGGAVQYECDWHRTRFTCDKGLSKAVRHIFFKLFKDGLIFRGKRLVNWDTQLQTAVSDDEVYHEMVKGHFWHIKYPVIPDPRRDRKGAVLGDEPEYVIIATTRPETMLADTAVAVHPDPEGFFNKHELALRDALATAGDKDKVQIEAKLETLAKRRESHLERLVQLRNMADHGRMLMLPLVERKIPLICDEWANPLLGSGCVKITPAHDPNDYEVGLRHSLPMINVLTPDGKIAPIVEPDPNAAPTKPGSSENVHSDEYVGLEFMGAGRDKVIAHLEQRSLIHEIEKRDYEMGHSDRSKVPIEPYLSDQWFIQTDNTDDGIILGDGSKVSGLAQAAIDAVSDGRIKVFPPRYAKSYLDWLREKRDWCISRQLWWGHRIPIWGAAHFEGTVPSTSDSLNWADQRLTCASGNKLTREQQSATWVHTWPSAADGKVYMLICISSGFSMIERWLEADGYFQDEDVLDTWFSSGLWPFSTLGWPEQTEHVKQYYPGSVLCTSRDIITNWVARMVMFGLYAMGEVPFDHVYIHPKILDGRGETMSKSKGNGVDPLDIIHTHGADALRYAMADMCTETQDIRMPVEYVCPHCGGFTAQELALRAETQARKSRGEKITGKLQPIDCPRIKCLNSECGQEFATQWADAATKKELGLGRETSDKFDVGRNFCNKLWNAARFAFMNLEQTPYDDLDISALPPEDRWILARLSQTIRRYHEYLANYQFSASVRELRDFFWDSLCDWYIELTKPRLSESRTKLNLDLSGVRPAKEVNPEPQAFPARRDANSPDSTNSTIEGTDPAKQVLAFCLDQILRLWHPTIPFITERLWDQLNQIAPKRGLPGAAELSCDSLLITASFPPIEGYPALTDDAILDTFSHLQNATRGVRDLRANCDVSPKDRVTATIVLPQDHLAAFQAQAHVVRHMANIGELNVVSQAKRPKNAGSLTVGNLRIYIHDVSNDEAERKRATKALEQLVMQIEGKQRKLSNDKFIANAKKEVVEAERGRLQELLTQRDSLNAHLAELDS